MNRILLALLLLGCGAARAPAHDFVPTRPATVPIEVCWLETAGTSASGGFGAAGWTRTPRWEATTSAILIKHPGGNVLIDAGLSPQPQEEARELSWAGRLLFSQTAGRNVPRADLLVLLRAAGVTKVKTLILSHAHPDHAGGAELLPGVPVLVGADEITFVKSGKPVVIPAQARALAGRLVRVPFTERPYESYDQSFDVFGDGTVVIVPTPGHTPGSIATFVNLGDRRFVHVGDLINLEESITRAVPKSALMRALTDEDGPATDAQVQKLVQLHAADPSLLILPAHDRAEWELLFGPMPIGSKVPRCLTSR